MSDHRPTLSQVLRQAHDQSLRITPQAISQWIRLGIVPAEKRGKFWTFDAATADQVLERARSTQARHRRGQSRA